MYCVLYCFNRIELTNIVLSEYLVLVEVPKCVMRCFHTLVGTGFQQ